jgi:catechol 2,3-dioxygenase
VRDPEELEASGAPATAAIAAETTVGPVHLTVAELERSLAYYGDAVGLATLSRENGRATLGAGDRELRGFESRPRY